MRDVEWLAQMRQRPVHPLRRMYSWLTWYGRPSPLSGPPPTGLEGFVDGHLLWFVLVSLVPIPVRMQGWRSADGRILASVMQGKLFLTSHLRSGLAVNTWPDDPNGRRLARRAEGRISLVGGPDAVARHAAELERLAAAGDPAVSFGSLATQIEAGRVYDLHNTALSTAVTPVLSLGLTVASLGLAVGSLFFVWAVARAGAPPCVVRLPVAASTGAVGQQLGQWCHPDRRSRVNGLAWLGPDRLLVVSARDGLTAVDLTTGASTPWTEGSLFSGPFTAATLPGERVAVGYDDGHLEIRRFDGSLVGQAEGFGNLRRVAPVGADHLASFGNDGTVALSAGGAPERSVDVGQAWCGATASDGTIWACSHGALLHFDAALTELERVDLPFHATWGVTLGADGRVWATGDPGGLSVWDGTSRRDVPWTGGADATLRDVAALDRGVVVGTWRGELVFLDDAGEYARVQTGTRVVQTVLAHPDGAWVAAGGEHGMVWFHAAR
jgi:hypothetical protein